MYLRWLITMVFTIGKITINGQEVSEEEFQRRGAEKRKRRGGVIEVPGASAKAKWPIESDAAGVHPDQVPEAIAHAASKGVPTEFNPRTGNPIFRSRKHRNEFLKAHGMRDRDAGYGDYAGQ